LSESVKIRPLELRYSRAGDHGLVRPATDALNSWRFRCLSHHAERLALLSGRVAAALMSGARNCWRSPSPREGRRAGRETAI